VFFLSTIDVGNLLNIYVWGNVLGASQTQTPLESPKALRSIQHWVNIWPQELGENLVFIVFHYSENTLISQSFTLAMLALWIAKAASGSLQSRIMMLYVLILYLIYIYIYIKKWCYMSLYLWCYMSLYLWCYMSLFLICFILFSTFLLVSFSICFFANDQISMASPTNQLWW
jgi:hypothetical protein